MRNFTFKGLFLTAVFMLLGCLSIQAADDDLITRQITIKLDKAGTLPDRIGSSKKYKITNLKLVGEINGTDWKMIREMAGRDYSGKDTEGKLSVLDLSEAKIVNGGDEYYDHGGCTSNDQMGFYAFYNCSRLTSLTLPAGITSIGEYAFRGCSGLTSIYVYSEKVPKWVLTCLKVVMLINVQFMYLRELMMIIGSLNLATLRTLSNSIQQASTRLQPLLMLRKYRAIL